MKPELFVLAISEEQALKSFSVLLAFDTIEAAIFALKTMQPERASRMKIFKVILQCVGATIQADAEE